MKFHLFITLAFVASAVSYCHSADTEDDDLSQDFQFALSVGDVADEYVIETLKNIANTIKNRISVLLGKTVEAASELKKVAGEKGQELKKHLKELWGEIGQARDQLKQKVRETFAPSQYSEAGKLRDFEPIRVKLQHVLGQLKEGSDPERLRGILRDLCDEIQAKVFQYHASRPAQYSEDVETVYIVKTLKELYGTVKGKLGELFDKIKAKAAELKRTVGAKAAEVREELKSLRKNLAAARDDVKDKVKEIFRPSQYSTDNSVQEVLRPLREKFEKFLKDTEEVTEENVDELRKALRGVRSGIKDTIRALRKRTAVAYSAEEEATLNAEAYEQVASTVYDELLGRISELEKLASQDNPNKELIDKELQKLEELRKNVEALQEKVVQPPKYFVKPLFEKLNKVFANSTVKILQFVNKVSKIGKVVKEAVGHVSKHVKHTFGKIKEIVARGRDEVHQQVKDIIGQQDGTTTTSVQAAYSTTPVSQTVSDVTDSRTTTVETSWTTEASLPGFGEPVVSERS